MKISIHGKPEFHLPLTMAHVELLTACSEAHYDHRCKQASQVGGFIYGWKNRLAFPTDLEELNLVSGDWGDLDLCLKILEASHYMNVSKALITELRTAFYSAMRAATRLRDVWVYELVS